MDNVARYSAKDRSDLFIASAVKRQIVPALVEKDFWVCWTLRRLYALEGLPTGILFKGGTSLSKVFHVIQRFSEDIDLSLDRAALGFAGDADPAAAPSRKQREKRLAELSTACQSVLREVFLPKLRDAFAASLGATEQWDIIPAADDPDGQTLLFRYPVAVTASAYVPSLVRLEFGARSDHWAVYRGRRSALCGRGFSADVCQAHKSVHVLAAERTFWEKATANLSPACNSMYCGSRLYRESRRHDSWHRGSTGRVGKTPWAGYSPVPHRK